MPAFGSLALPPALVALALVSSCATTRHDVLAPLRDSRPQEVRLEIAPTGGLEQPLDGRFDRPESDRPAVTARVRLLAVPAQGLVEALGERGRGLFGVVCPRAEAARLVAELLAPERDGLELNDMTLTLLEDQEGYVSVVDQQAYVAGFELVATGQEVIADPRVEVVSDGVLLQLRARRDPATGGHAVALELICAELDRPLAQRSLDIVGNGVPVTIQMPAGVIRRLTCGASPRADEALLVGGRAVSVDALGRVLLAVVELEAVELDAPDRAP